MDYGIVARDVALVMVEFLKILAWPGVILVALFTFREPIKKILSNLEHAEMAGVSFKIRASELSKKVEQLPEKLKKKDEGSTRPPSPEPELEEMDAEATAVLDSAKAQIKGSWASLANETGKLHISLFNKRFRGEPEDTPYVQPRSVVQAVTDFHRRGMIDAPSLETFRSAERLNEELLENANSATFETYGQFLNTIGRLRARVHSWVVELT